MIPYVSEKKTLKEMFDALFSLYYIKSINMKMIYQNKLKSIVMTKSHGISYSEGDSHKSSRVQY
jgi:hypothetical protein